MKRVLTTICLIIFTFCFSQTHIDSPFVQDYSEKFKLVKNQNLIQVKADRNKNISVLTSGKLVHPWKGILERNLLYSPVTDEDIIGLDTYKNQFIFLTNKVVFSNAWAGRIYQKHKVEKPICFSMGAQFVSMVASEKEAVIIQANKVVWRGELNAKPIAIKYDKFKDRFLLLTAFGVYEWQLKTKKLIKVYSGINLSALAVFKDKLVIGNNLGLVYLNTIKKTASILEDKLPWTKITTIANIDGEVWVGTTKGAFNSRKDKKYNYYASKRWLVDDEVVAISQGPDKSVLILTKKGMSKINFVEMTLEEKASYFQEIQRKRHIRYGFTGTTNLKVAGDLSSSVLIDTDNDGLWTSMYLAGELFRYAVTKSEDAKLNAYEAFEAMERLTEISKIAGFPARTYEIDSFQSGDRDPNMLEEDKIWRLTDDKRWRWKSTTSSDESCGHFFVYALFAEIAPDASWRKRAIHQLKIEMDHIIDNNWYLVSWNGKPTEWGRWNPEYVNEFPINVGDRRLNSTLILSFLQTTYHFTKDKKYLKAAKKTSKKVWLRRKC